MNKLIINNRTDLTDIDAVNLVKQVIESGRISNNGMQYCYITIIKLGGKEYVVCADLNKKSDRFLITDY